MRIAISLLALSWAALACAQPLWAPAPAAYKLSPDGAIEISDGGQSTPDTYLLSARDYRSFSFEFDLIAKPAGGATLRAIIVWALDPANNANRKAFFLPVDTMKVGQRAHFRVLVLGTRSSLYRDGQLIASSSVNYGEPPAAGRVGFLHYYNHNFRYENVKLESLDTGTLAQPTGLQARVTKGGVVRLSWEVQADYADALRYRVRRGDRTSETSAREFADPDVRSNTTYTYTVESLADENLASKPAGVSIKTGDLPPPAAPRSLSATVRLDGSVRLRWTLDPDSRCAGVALFSLAAPQSAPVGLAVVAPTQTEFLSPPPAASRYLLAVKSPDGGAGSSLTCDSRPVAPALSVGGGVPARHPYLLYSAPQLDHVRRALQTKEYEKLLTSLRGSAEGYLRQPAAVPVGVTDEMGAVTSRMQQMGLYYQLLGDERCAEWVHDALLRYAKLYASLPARGGRVKLSKTISGLYESLWFVPLVCAYDLVYESPGLTAPERVQIERDLLRPGADLFWVRDYNDPKDNRPGDLHYKCYNFEAWFDSAVGLAGLLLKDAGMVEHAIDGPYGLKHLLAHDVQDDGLFWERSAGYHSFVVSALFPLLEAAAHCNLDLYKLSVPDDYNADREPIINYCVGDGDNGPKSMKLMFDGPFYYTFPDLTWPVVADSSKGPLAVNAPYRAAWEHYRDPKYAWLINRDRAVAPPQLGAKDAEAKVWMSWDDRCLYLAADITDQVVRNSWSKPGDVWQGDALWVGLKWRGGEGGPYDFIYGLSPGDFAQVPPVAALFNRFGAANAGVSAGQYAVTKTPEGYALELAIPLAELAPQGAEQGKPFLPQAGGKLQADFVLYDCDAKEGPTTKEKMVCWSCTTDRYDSAEGGTVVLGAAALPPGPKAISAPRAGGLTIDGKLDDWARLGARPAIIGPGSTIMTDASSSGPNLDDLLYERPPTAGKFDYTGDGFANNGLLESGCSLFPSTGFALLRSGTETGPTGTAVNLSFGPYGGGHGHPDKLSVVLWRDGKQLIPDFGSCGYDSAEKAQWTAHTVSHNTLTVDGKSQYPALDTDKTWPVDTFEKRAVGKLNFFHADPFLKIARASCDNVFEGVKLTRTVVLVEGQVLDFYRVQSNEQHVYDYTLHIDAPFKAASLPLSPLPDPLGKTCGYQHIHKAQGSEITPREITATFGDDKAGLTVTALPGAPTRAIVGQSITAALDRLMPVLILRREATDTTFATALQTTPSPATWRMTQDRGGFTATNGGASVVILSPDATQPFATGGVRFTGALAGMTTAGPAPGTSLVQGTMLEAGGLMITADRPVSFFVGTADGRPTHITMSRSTGGALTLLRPGRPPLTATLKPGERWPVPQ